MRSSQPLTASMKLSDDINIKLHSNARGGLSLAR